MFKRIILTCSFLLLASSSLAKTPKALYLTDYSNLFHDYRAQVETFLPALQKQIDLEIDVIGKTKEELLATLAKRDFAVNYDLIIYNACLADTRDFRLARNLIDQFEKYNRPVMLIHCALHNFRKTSSKLGPLDRWALKQDQKRWAREYPDEEFPIWWKFAGADSTRHTLLPGKVKAAFVGSHPITVELPPEHTFEFDERYIIKNIAEDTEILAYRGSSNQPIAWVVEKENSRLFATTIGQDERTLLDPVFLKMMGNAAHWLLD